MKGTWNGYYKYDNAIIQKIIGFEKTNFTIVIHSFDGNNFEGIVNDDTTTGGMPDTGEVRGSVKGNEISFVKQMPKRVGIIDDKGTRLRTDEKHKPLYYSGKFSTDKKEINGEWKFNIAIALLWGFIPLPYRPGKGTWGMKISLESWDFSKIKN